MNILFLNAYFQPENIAFSPLENDLINGFISAGHEITVICPVPTRGISKEIAEKYKTIKREELYDGKVHVRRFWTPQEGRNPIIRALRYFWCNFREYQIGAKQKHVDIVFAGSTPPTQGFLLALLKRRLKKPIVYGLQDIFPDSLVTAGMTKRDSLLWKVGRWVEDKGYAGADRIITISDDFLRNIMEKGVPAEKVKVIPNWINTESVYPVPREENILFDRYGLDRKDYYICYSGNLGHSQNLPLLVETAKKLQNEMPEVKFILFGEGAEKETLQTMVHTEQLSNMVILPFQPYEEISHVFSLGDVGLIISKPGIGNSSVPSKTWSIMAAERPVLASFDKESQLANLIDRLQIGVTAQAGDVDALIEAIRFLYKNRDKANAMGKGGRVYVSDVIAKDKCVEQYVQLMESLVK